jgi:hypothetical protein
MSALTHEQRRHVLEFVQLLACAALLTNCLFHPRHAVAVLA